MSSAGGPFLRVRLSYGTVSCSENSVDSDIPRQHESLDSLSQRINALVEEVCHDNHSGINFVDCNVCCG